MNNILITVILKNYCFVQDATKFPRLTLYENTKTIIILKYNFNIDLYDEDSDIMRKLIE
jgi:hypothetical protein